MTSLDWSASLLKGLPQIKKPVFSLPVLAHFIPSFSFLIPSSHGGNAEY